MKKLRFLTVTCLAFALAMAFCANATAATLKTTMTVSDDQVSFYRTETMAAGTKGGIIRFGTNVRVLSKNATVAKVVTPQGYKRYVKTSGLSYLQAVATGPSQKLYTKASTAKGNKGYVIRGQQMTVLGEIKLSSGETLLKVTVDRTYTDALGSAVRFLSKQTGYIKKSKTAEASTLMVTKDVTTLLAKPQTDVWVSKKVFGAGNVMKVISTNGTWAKVVNAGKTWYVQKNKMAPYTKNITCKSLSMYKTASPDSQKLATYYWNTPIQIVYEQSINGSTYAFVNKGSNAGFMLMKSSSGAVNLDYTGEAHAIEHTYLYKTANQSAKPSTNLPEFTRVTVISPGSLWTKVRYDGTTGFVYSEDLAYPTATISGSYFTSAYNCHKNVPAGTFDEETVEVLAISRSANFAYVRTQSDQEYWVNSAILIPDSVSVENQSVKDPKLYVATTLLTLYYKPDKKAGYTYASYCDPVTYLDSRIGESGAGWIEVDYKGETYYVYQKQDDTLFMGSVPNMVYGTNNMQRAVCAYALDFAFNKKTVYNNKLHEGHGEVDSKGRYNFHCSGFVAHVFNTVMQSNDAANPFHWNITTSCAKLEKVGYVNKEKTYKAKKIWDKRTSAGNWYDNIQPGDVMLFERGDEDEDMDHTGIYVGNGIFVHCTSAYGFKRCVVSKASAVYGSEGSLTVVMRYLPTDVDLLK